MAEMAVRTPGLSVSGGRCKGKSMLNISSTSAVSWPTPVAIGVAPVTPVAAVQPAQASGGSDGQTQTGFGREGRAPQQRQVTAAGRSGAEARAPAEASHPAALPRDPNTLPREPAPPDAGAQRQARQEAARVAEQDKARDRQAIEHLQTVLSNMWEASAAVVDRALGREPASGDTPDAGGDTAAPDLSQAAAIEARGGDVVAYDERGASSLAPLEAGSLISHRV
jgi:hypothetical protein